LLTFYHLYHSFITHGIGCEIDGKWGNRQSSPLVQHRWYVSWLPCSNVQQVSRYWFSHCGPCFKILDSRVMTFFSTQSLLNMPPLKTELKTILKHLMSAFWNSTSAGYTILPSRNLVFADQVGHSHYSLLVVAHRAVTPRFALCSRGWNIVCCQKPHRDHTFTRNWPIKSNSCTSWLKSCWNLSWFEICILVCIMRFSITLARLVGRQNHFRLLPDTKCHMI